ncbi:MAG: 7-carboxy-7-deazaguanine synthase QueE [Gammaproteobacteria bacterium]|jgi:7-carboxy-7-deazaguanine synthase
MSENTLNITEIFYSIQGEALEVGLPTVFIRLTGCPLRCGYCDTTYAFKGNNPMTIDQIIEKVREFPTHQVCVTGGEPLAQKNVHLLLNDLVKNKYQVSLETSGSIDISEVNHAVSIVMDVKTPSSGEEHQNLISNLQYIKSSDQIKFVIGDMDDFRWTEEFIQNKSLEGNILISPVFGQVDLRDLADWLMQSKIKARLQVQLHKIIWGDEPGR